MGNTDRSYATIGRRDLMVAGLGAASLAAGISGAAHGQAQQTQPTAPASTAAAAGKVNVEQRGAVLLIGIDRPQAQNRVDAPIQIGLGKAYYQLDHDDGLRAAVLYGVGRDFCLGVDRAAFAAAQAAGVLPPKDPDFINPLGLKPPLRSKPVVVAVQGGTAYGRRWPPRARRSPPRKPLRLPPFRWTSVAFFRARTPRNSSARCKRSAARSIATSRTGACAAP
jgi:enoyl-CoA hydratase